MLNSAVHSKRWVLVLAIGVSLLLSGVLVLSAGAHQAQAKTLKAGGYYFTSNQHDYDYGYGHVNKISWHGNKVTINGKIKRYKNTKAIYDGKAFKTYKGKKLTFKLSKKIRYYGEGGDPGRQRVSKKSFVKMAHRYNGLDLKVVVKNGRAVTMSLCS